MLAELGYPTVDALVDAASSPVWRRAKLSVGARKSSGWDMQAGT
jgi:hypothetical protein